MGLAQKPKSDFDSNTLQGGTNNTNLWSSDQLKDPQLIELESNLEKETDSLQQLYSKLRDCLCNVFYEDHVPPDLFQLLQEVLEQKSNVSTCF